MYSLHFLWSTSPVTSVGQWAHGKRQIHNWHLQTRWTAHWRYQNTDPALGCSLGKFLHAHIKSQHKHKIGLGRDFSGNRCPQVWFLFVLMLKMFSVQDRCRWNTSSYKCTNQRQSFRQSPFYARVVRVTCIVTLCSCIGVRSHTVTFRLSLLAFSSHNTCVATSISERAS